MAKGVDVENYPGLPLEHGGKMIQTMKQQARKFYTEVRDDTVVEIDTSARPSGPFRIKTNNSDEVVLSHTVIIATGADSKWLEVEGEWEYRGHGVSSCAVCDGALYKDKPCAVVGGGDTAMEEALYLSRVCSSVVLLHRRGEFRASQVLQQRVLENPNIEVRYHTAVASFQGISGEKDGQQHTALTHVVLRDTRSQEALDTLEVAATFVAIGHNPNTKLFAGTKASVEMDTTGYIQPRGRGTSTSLPGIFAAGDVADHTYRQAVTSAGSGAMAALDAERFLSENPPEEDTCVRQTDFSTWNLKEVRAKLEDLGVKCSGCVDKSEFVSKLRAQF
jgi:thioredoxin reductase